MRNVVITGGSDGIGKALAKSLNTDFHVTLLARSPDKLEQLASETGCDFVVCDVRKSSDVKDAFDEIKSRHGSVDILINNAGIIVNGDLTETSYETIETVISTNTTGAIFVTKACLEIMKPQKSGLIINIISQAGITAKPYRSVYNASKWALTGFTKAIQQEASEYGVRITGFYPGTVSTDLFAKAGLDMHGPALDTSQVVKTIKFMVDADEDMLFPELGLKPFIV
ncbi:MAG TPA: SDR family oxidoreductase [Patescibacteria group bacterium]|nr:SDR family oxidoreductase [Patescibacteria group bacterium]